MEERSISLQQRGTQFYNDLATVVQEIDLMKRKTNGRKK